MQNKSPENIIGPDINEYRGNIDYKLLATQTPSFVHMNLKEKQDKDTLGVKQSMDIKCLLYVLIDRRTKKVERREFIYNYDGLEIKRINL